MPFYFVIFFVVAVFAYMELQYKPKTSVLYLLSAVFFVLGFMRWEVGTDWDSYLLMFETFEYDDYWLIEPLYSIILVFARHLTHHYTYALLFFSLILFFFQTRGLQKISVLPVVSLFALVGMSFANVFFVRQSIAQAILLFSIYYIQQRKLFSFLLCIVLAMGFHNSSIVFIPAYWLFTLNLSKKQILIFTFASIFLSNMVESFLGGIGSGLGENILYKINSYVVEKHEDDNTSLSVLEMTVKAIANRFIFYVIGFYLYDKAKDDPSFKHIKSFFVLYVIGTILFFLLNPISNVLSRACRYYDVAQIFLISYFFAYQIKKKNVSLFFIILLLFLALKLYMYITGYDCYIPYNWTPLLR